MEEDTWCGDVKLPHETDTVGANDETFRDTGTVPALPSACTAALVDRRLRWPGSDSVRSALGPAMSAGKCFSIHCPRVTCHTMEGNLAM